MQARLGMLPKPLLPEIAVRGAASAVASYSIAIEDARGGAACLSVLR